MADAQKTPFVRDLASSGKNLRGNAIKQEETEKKLTLHADRKTRDKALESLTLFLRSRTNLSLIELLKLWKGLFFCTSGLFITSAQSKKKLQLTHETRLLSLRQTSDTAGAGSLALVLAGADAAPGYGASVPARVLDHDWTGVSLD